MERPKHNHQLRPTLRQHPGNVPSWRREAEQKRIELKRIRKAEKEERERFGKAVAVLGLSYLGELLAAITKPAPAPNPAPTPLKSDETIIDAEFKDIS